MEQWKEYKISDIIEEIAMGPFGSNIKVDNFIDFGIPVLNGSNLQGFKLNEDSFNYVSEEKAESLGRANAFRGDVVITHRGTLGQIVYIPLDSKYEKYVISQSQFRLKLNQDLIRPDFLVYFFHTRIGQHRILMNASQVGVPALARPTSTFKEVSIPVPPMEIQNKIMSILLSLNNKIEINRRINDNLEQQAQALFKSWFVDFEPFRGGEFVDSALGSTPKELPIVYIEDIPHNIESGKRPKGGATFEGVPSIGAENIKGLGYYDYSKTKYIPKEYAQTIKKGKINGYELLIYKDGGKPGYFIPNFSIFGEGFPFNEMYINEHVFILDLMDNAYNAFAYFYMRTPYIMNQLNSIGGKAAIPGINTKDIECLPIYSNESPYVKRYGDIVLPFIKTILSNSLENARLAKMRDTLLPQLMSGELKISE
ncbi:restriction endonuclease subunit S [Phocaeicola vulgatus]|uniref:restriction endonuclease subunit S n=1 Tax=Phocaeicola vulgatus TaxID=821 RepID=UPI0032C16F72